MRGGGGYIFYKGSFKGSINGGCFHFCEKCHCFYLVFWSLAYILLIMICVSTVT